MFKQYSLHCVFSVVIWVLLAHTFGQKEVSEFFPPCWTRSETKPSQDSSNEQIQLEEGGYYQPGFGIFLRGIYGSIYCLYELDLIVPVNDLSVMLNLYISVNIFSSNSCFSRINILAHRIRISEILP